MTLSRTTKAAIVLLFASFASFSRADEYSDVAQLTRDGKYSEALTKADGFLAGKPRDAQMRFLKGVAQRDAGKSSDAISTFTRLTEDFPDLPEPHNNIGVIFAEQNQLDKARAAFEAALRTHPSYAAAHENLGDLYAKLSSAAYSKALQIDGSVAANPKLALMRQLVGPGQPRITLVAAAKPVAAAPVSPPATVAARDPAKDQRAPTGASAQASPKARAPSNAGPDGAPREAEAAVQNWVTAWSNKDLKNYFGAYSKDFRPSNGGSRNAWEAERRSRIEGKAKISVRVEGLRVTVNGGKATAKFRQDYRANGLAISSRKTLELVKQPDGWKITRETVGGA
ncbi:MAG: tetratricopeptide repeat protein [Rhodoferax sp.]|nr:tetratricopeptide repeat protein [Rhodoferax sp.]